MERKSNQNAAAFTRLELLVVLVILIILALGASMLRPVSRVHNKAPRISCVNNLKQIGIAYRVWENDNNDKFPALASIGVATNAGGWKDYLINQNQGAWCWTNYFILQNELGQAPKVLLCPADERAPALSFTNFHNLNISYFVGVGANSQFPQAILGGDRNLTRGLEPKSDYGFSPKDGSGNDIAIQTNAAKDPISWSKKMHHGAGNVLLGDASVQQVSGTRFGTDSQPFALDSGNWPSNHVPTVPSFRLIFP